MLSVSHSQTIYDKLHGRQRDHQPWREPYSTQTTKISDDGQPKCLTVAFYAWWSNSHVSVHRCPYGTYYVNEYFFFLTDQTDSSNLTVEFYGLLIPR